MQFTAVQCNAMQCSAGQYSAIQCSRVQYSVVQYSTVQLRTAEWRYQFSFLTIPSSVPAASRSCSVQCTLCNVSCTMYTLHCTLYNLHCVLYSLQCALCNIHCSTLYSTWLQYNKLHYTWLWTFATGPASEISRIWDEEDITGSPQPSTLKILKYIVYKGS